MTAGEIPMGRDIVVVGASAGGVSVLRSLAAQLPRDFPAAVFVVMHVRPDAPTLLPLLLERAGPLPASEAVDGAALSPGTIVVAPPDRHLILDPGVVRVVHGPRENRHRPSVDVLFRSAAHSHGSRVVGVVLTGTLDDGAAGVVAIRKQGGVAVVQDPADAEFPGMPLRALELGEADHVVTVDALGALLGRLVRERRPEPAGRDVARAAEVTMAHGQKDEMELIGQPSMFTCPECTGVLWEVNEPDVLRFRCRVGHAYSAESLLSGQEETREAALWAAMRALEENARLAERLADRFAQRRQPRLAERMRGKARLAQGHAHHLRAMISGLPDAGVAGETSS